MMEGFGCLLASLVGTTTGTTSYSENVAAIGVTRVASRRVSYKVIMFASVLYRNSYKMLKLNLKQMKINLRTLCSIPLFTSSN